MNKIFDKFGIVTSVLCIFHCVGVPLILSVLPLVALSQLGHSGSFHIGLMLLMFLFALLAFVTQFQKHRSWLPLYLFIVGLFFVGLGNWIKLKDHYKMSNLAHHSVSHAGVMNHHMHGTAVMQHHISSHIPIGTFILILGGMILIYGHYINLRTKVCCVS